MMRFLTRRMLSMHALGLVAVAVCLVAANWQWERAHVVRPSDYRTVDFGEASPLRTFLPVGSIAATTTVRGEWVPGWRLTVDRPATGTLMTQQEAPARTCSWVVDALRLPDDSVVAVVRGCGAIAPASGTATITGVLQPSEDSGLIDFVHGRPAITTDAVVKALGLTTHDGYLVATSPDAGLEKVTPILATPVSVPPHWRNVVYVFNWLIFAAIIAAMWLRVVRDEAAIDSTQED